MLLVAVTRTPDSGIWQAYLNGVKVGPQMNIYNDKVRDWEHHLLEFWPDPGKYTLNSVWREKINSQRARNWVSNRSG